MHTHPQSPQTRPDERTQKPPRNTSGANSAVTSVNTIKTEKPERSYSRPKTSEPVPLTPIAMA